MFFGLAVQMYESTLVSDDTPWDARGATPLGGFLEGVFGPDGQNNSGPAAEPAIARFPEIPVSHIKIQSYLHRRHSRDARARCPNLGAIRTTRTRQTSRAAPA